MQDPRFAGRGTFLGLPDNDTYRQDAAFWILPVPYDHTQSGWTGSRFAPGAILEASPQMEEYDADLGLDASRFGIATLPAVAPDVSGPAAMTERIFEVASDLLGSGKFLAALGGDHTVSLGLARAHHARHPDLTVVSLDAHGDLRDAYQGSRVGHATVMRRIAEFAPVAIAGYRTLAEEEVQFLARGTVTAVAARDVKGEPRRAWERVAPQIGRNVYLSLDIDVLDPSIMPAVGTPEPGGLSWDDLLGFLDCLTRERQVVGCDLVELLPIPGLAAPNVIAAKLLYRLLGLLGRQRV